VFFRRYDASDGLAHWRHDVFVGTGLRGTVLLKYADLSASLMRQKELNRYTEYQNDVSNLHAELSAQLRW
jgi:hypothetical protein